MKFAYEQEAFLMKEIQIKVDIGLDFVPTAEGFFDLKKNEYIYQYKPLSGSPKPLTLIK